MGAQRFLRWVISSIVAFVIVLLLINLVTSFFINLSVDTTIPIIVSTVYDYASPQAQQPVIALVDSMCNDLNDRSQNGPTTQAACLPQNQESLQKICAQLETLPKDTQDQYRAACEALADGSLQSDCNPAMDNETIDLTQSCKELNASQITHNDFLVTTFSRLAEQQVNAALAQSDTNLSPNSYTNTTNTNGTQDMSAAGSLKQHDANNANAVTDAAKMAQLKEAFNIIKESQNKYLGWKLAAVVLLFVLWYLISESVSDFVQKVSRMFFSIGMLIFAIWLVSIILSHFFPPDTSILLQTITGTGDGTQPQLAQLLPLLPVIVLGLIGETVLIIGCAGISIAFLLYLIRRYFLDARSQAQQI